MSEAKSHHYIPQNILKNFLDNKGQVFYWDIEKEVSERRNPKSIFMNFNMYIKSLIWIEQKARRQLYGKKY